MHDQALKRRIYPREFAQMVLFLAADDGAACTAQSFLVASMDGRSDKVMPRVPVSTTKRETENEKFHRKRKP